MITIVDYVVCNQASVQNMLKRCGIKSKFTSSVEQIESAEKIILPGVGAFDFAIGQIDQLGLWGAIVKAAEAGTKILGICLGAQLLMESSEEGGLPGLSLVKGFCKKFDTDEIKPLRIPHMGWSDVSFSSLHHPLLSLMMRCFGIILHTRIISNAQIHPMYWPRVFMVMKI